MPSATLSATATAAPCQIAIERRDGRTVYSWHRPMDWGGTIAGSLLMALCALPFPWLAGLSFVTCIVSASVYHRYGRQVLELSPEGLRVSLGWRGERMLPNAIPLNPTISPQAGTMGDGYWGVYIMAPGHLYKTSVSGLTTRREAEWLAGAIEAEIRTRGHDL